MTEQNPLARKLRDLLFEIEEQGRRSFSFASVTTATIEGRSDAV